MGKKRISEEKKRLIYDMHDTGLSQHEISRRIGISQSSICIYLKKYKDELKEAENLLEEMYGEEEKKEIIDNKQELKKIEKGKNEYDKSHYDFMYKLTEKDIKKEKIKIDPYFVASVWNIQDNTGVLFHNLKNIARYGKKNSKGREIKSIYYQIKRLAELLNIDLET
jgi:predicted transcriptional regulator